MFSTSANIFTPAVNGIAIGDQRRTGDGLIFMPKTRKGHQRMETVIAIAVSVVSTVISGTLALAVQTLLKDNKRLRQERQKENLKKEAATQEGVTSLLRVQLIEYHEKYTTKNSIPNYAFENWDKMFKAYQGLGGNGMVVEMDNDIRALEFKK